MGTPQHLPKNVLIILGFASLLSAAGGLWIARDLYSGIMHGVFYLVRATPVVKTETMRYKLAITGESLAVFLLLGLSLIFAGFVIWQIKQRKS